MNGLSIEELITKAHEEKVRIEVEITPDEYEESYFDKKPLIRVSISKPGVEEC